MDPRNLFDVYTTPSVGGLTAEMHCGACGGEATHLDEVTAAVSGGSAWVVTAHGEDERARLTLDTGTATDDVGRRHRFTLAMTCENCDAVTTLAFKQHKGTTFVEAGWHVPVPSRRR